MLVIRLRRIGKKNKPTYRVVLAEHTWAASGKFTADLGFYNPHTKEFKVDKDTILDWLKKGAQPSNTIARLLEGIKLKHASIVVVKKKKAAKKAKDEKETKPTVAAKVDEVANEPSNRTEADDSAKIEESAVESASENEEGEVTAEVDTNKDAEVVDAEIREEVAAEPKSDDAESAPVEK